MEAINRLIETNLGALAVAGAGLLAAGLVLDLPDRRPAPSLASLSRTRPAAPAPPAAVPPAKTRAEDAGPMSLEEFLAKLEASAPAPAAASFAKAFLGHEPLKRELARARRERVPAQDFARRVTRLPQFRQLMNQFRSEPGFQRAFLRLSRDSEAHATPRAAPAAGSSAAGRRTGAPREASNQTTGLNLAAGDAPRAAGRGSSGGGSFASGRSSGPQGAGSAGAAGPRDASSSPSSAAAENTARANAPAGDERSDASGDDGGTLRPLAPLAWAGPSREAGSFLDSLFATAPRELREALLYQCEAHDICDPVQACLAAGALEQCVAACQANPSCAGRGIFPTGTEAGHAAQGGASLDRKDLGRKSPKLMRNPLADGWPLPRETAQPPSHCPAPEPPPEPGPLDVALIGSVLGGIAGGLLGGALGGPAGAVLGAAVGAGAGGHLGDALAELGISW